MLHLKPKYFKNDDDKYIDYWKTYKLIQIKENQQFYQYTHYLISQPYLMSAFYNPESTPRKQTNRIKQIDTSDFKIYSNIDTQYNLCQSFMKMTGDQLVQQQLQMMIKSKNLLNTLQQKISSKNFQIDNSFSVVNKSLASSTKVIDNSVLQSNNDNVSSQSRVRRTISRKNNSSSHNKIDKTNQSLVQAIEDIKQNCQRVTYNQITSILNQYRALQKKCAQFECKQKPVHFNRTQNSTQSTINTKNEQYQQTIILTARSKKLQKQNSTLKQKVNSLQQKIKAYKEQILQLNCISATKQKKDENSLKTLQLKKFIELRKKQFDQKYQQMESLSTKILDTLSQQFIKNGCQKCCSMMKKIKQSLMSYRLCLRDLIKQQQAILKSYRQDYQRRQMS